METDTVEPTHENRNTQKIYNWKFAYVDKYSRWNLFESKKPANIWARARGVEVTHKVIQKEKFRKGPFRFVHLNNMVFYLSLPF